MNLQETSVLLGMNKSNYPYAYRDMSAKEGEFLLKSWQNAFAQLSAETVYQAYGQALTYCKNPVTIADIYSILRRVQAAAETPTEVLWQQAIVAANRVYLLSQGFDYNGESFRYPGITQGQERRREATSLFDSLPPICQTWFGSLSRMIDIGSMENDKLEQIIFPGFRRFVEGDRERESMRRECPRLLEKTVSPVEMTGGDDYSEVYK